MFRFFPAGPLGVFVACTFAAYFGANTLAQQLLRLRTTRRHSGQVLSDDDQQAVRRQQERLGQTRLHLSRLLYVFKTVLMGATLIAGGVQVGGVDLNDVYLTVVAVVLWCELCACWQPQCPRCRVRIGFHQKFLSVSECPCCGVGFQRIHRNLETDTSVDTFDQSRGPPDDQDVKKLQSVEAG